MRSPLHGSKAPCTSWRPSHPLSWPKWGRDLIRSGDSMHVIDVDRMGRISLLPCFFLALRGGRASASLDRKSDLLRAVHVHDTPRPLGGCRIRPLGLHAGPAIQRGPGRSPGPPQRPASRARPSAPWRTRRAGPWPKLLAVPQDGGDDSEDDPLSALKADVRPARGRALLVETTAAGWARG